jgi:hypothetical protein
MSYSAKTISLFDKRIELDFKTTISLLSVTYDPQPDDDRSPGFTVHVGVHPKDWGLGITYERYDMCMTYLRLGPLGLVAAANGSDLYERLWPYVSGPDDESVWERWRDMWRHDD